MTIPSTYTPGVHYFVHINSATYRVQALFTFTKPSVSVSGEYGPKPIFGQPAFARGSGFAANEAVDLTWDLGALGTVKAGVAAADVGGSFFSTFTMPSIPFGVQAHLLAHGRISGLSASTFIVQPNVSISPNSGYSGTPITVRGRHFTLNGFAEVLWVFPNGGSGGSSGGGQFITAVRVSSHGTFNTTIFAPQGLISGVKYYVQVIDGPTGASNQSRFLAL
jgi:hypothetical protein